jgi:hypothetical protein
VNVVGKGRPAHRRPGRLARIRRVSSFTDALELVELAAGIVRRRL